VPTKTTLSLPLLSWTGERKYEGRLKGRDKDRERSLTSYRAKQTELREKREFHSSPIKSEEDSEK